MLIVQEFRDTTWYRVQDTFPSGYSKVLGVQNAFASARLIETLPGVCISKPT